MFKIGAMRGAAIFLSLSDLLSVVSFPHRRSRIPLSTWLTAARAADSKKALDLRVLDLRGVTSFADYFVICSGSNPRQIQAIADAVEKDIAEAHGQKPMSVEGGNNAEWLLMDYGDLIVHVFSESARKFYDLERLWRQGKVVELPAVTAAAGE